MTTPTEDTPTCNNDHENFICPKHSNLPRQEDRQLREAIKKILYEVRFTKHADDGADELLALFTTAQLQLVSELEGELPEKAYLGKKPDLTPNARNGWNNCLDEVKALLEHKKQELERGK